MAEVVRSLCEILMSGLALSHILKTVARFVIKLSSLSSR